MDAFQPLANLLRYDMGKEVRRMNDFVFLALLVIMIIVLSLSEKNHP